MEEEVPVTEDHMDVVVELTDEEVIEESPTSAYLCPSKILLRCSVLGTSDMSLTLWVG